MGEFDQEFYYVLVTAAVGYVLTLLNTVIPNSDTVQNPFLKGVLVAWEAISGNFLKNANRKANEK